MTNEENKNIFNSENLLSFIFSKWKPLLIVAIIAMIGSVVVSFLLPEKYKASVLLFSTQNNNLSRAFLSQQEDDTKDFLAFGEDNNADQLLQILKSDAVMYALEKKFDLMNYYHLQDKPKKWYLFKGYYADLFQYEVTQYESIQITVCDHDPKLASDMANAAADMADSIIRQIVKQRSVVAYKIAKSEYDSAIAVADKLNDTMNFYHNQGILDWSYQIKELTAGYADALVKGNAQVVKQLSDKLNVFQRYGDGFMKVTAQLTANYEWLKQARTSYMEAKVNAEQSIPAFYVVDRAVPADRKSYPIRGLVVAIGTLVPVIFALLLLLILNRLKKVRNQEL